LGGITSLVSVKGQAGADAIVLSDADGFLLMPGSSYTITSTDVTRNGHPILHYDTAESLVLNAGGGGQTIHVASTLAATPVVVNGGLGNDTFQVGGTNATALAGRVTLNGQDGTDTLDYSAFTAAVRVNLALGTATGVAGGVSGIENVTGG